jgi:transcriptional regulator with XRE-family HTH domain
LVRNDDLSGKVATMKEDTERAQLAAHLGDMLRRARKSAKLTQGDVAKRVDIATEVLGRIERGNMLPSLRNLRRLCRVLQLDANAMLALGPEKVPPWAEDPAAGKEALPEFRQLMRTLRLMDAAQLTLVNITANAVLRYAGQRTEDPSE